MLGAVLVTSIHQLFAFLADQILHEMQVPGVQKIVLVTKETKVHCNQRIDVSMISDCNHEEADTRLILHSLHARQSGSKNIMILTVDTDVVVLATAYEKRLGAGETWIGFGTGKDFRYIPIHVNSTKLSENPCPQWL